MRRLPLQRIVLALAALASAGAAVPAELEGSAARETILVTARLREENAQSVPISMSIVGGDKLDVTPLTSNIQQILPLVPSLNYVSPNPRNTAFTIRGLGSSVVAVSQANDGLEPGVGFYVDQVYHARPATAAFDFLDLERVEVLRGPQGTLFGKNTTAGAINIASRAPTRRPEAAVSVSRANDDYRQLKAAANGPLGSGNVAGRIAAQITERDGVLYNPRSGRNLNDVGTTGARGQLAFAPSDRLAIRVSADHSSIHSACCTQVYFGVAPTLKAVERQYAALAAGANYSPPSLEPFARIADIDGQLLVDTSEGGVASILDRDLGGATLTAITAWRYWQWDAENDRDYTGLSIQTSQHIPSRQQQWSQELRFASNGERNVDYVAGLYWFAQTIEAQPITVYGPLAAYWLLGPAPAIPTNLLDGYRTDGATRFRSGSHATFGEITWHAAPKLEFTFGTRYTWEDKHGSYAARVSGGLDTAGDAALTSRKLSILQPQAYVAAVEDDDGSGRLVASYALAPAIMGYAIASRGYKSGGINLAGLPLDAASQPAVAMAVIKPEKNATYELGAKLQLLDGRWLLNVDVYDTRVDNYQANVVDTAPGALRGYLANIAKVRVRGAELDTSLALGARFVGRASIAYTDGRYGSYANGPCPIERIGNSTTVCDLSGKPLPAQPRLTQSLGGEFRTPLAARALAEFYVSVDVATRSHAHGDPSDSQYTIIEGYTLVNASVGVRNLGPIELSLWARNLLAADYLQNVTVQAGNSGLIVGTPSEPRSVGLTLRAHF